MSAGRATALLEEHRKLGAKLTEFAGWDMPLQYSGVVAEHNAVRTSAGLFDVSHLGKLRVTGAEGGDALQNALTADAKGLEPGRATYSIVLNDDGGCVDDVFLYRLERAEWLVVPNAANVEAVASRIRASGAEPVDEWDKWSILALQGPSSFEVFERVFPGRGASELGLHRFVTTDLSGSDGILARTGYTGERGFELYVSTAHSIEVFAALLDAGATPVGLGARDTLRLEMGYALYGHELSAEVNPLEAGLGWAIAWDTPFRGRDALARVREEGPRRRLFGVRCTSRGVPRQGFEVGVGEAAVGTVTSGNFSPTLGTGIALALGPTELVPAPGGDGWIQARGRRLGGVIVKPPFVPRGRAPDS